MKRVLYIQNGEYDQPDLIGQVLAEMNIQLDVIHAWKQEAVPTAADAWDAFILGGGAMSAYEVETYPWLVEQIALIKAARTQARPVLGLCLGAQLMATAFGGVAYPNLQKEVGFFDVRFTAAAEKDPLWTGYTSTFQPVHWHGDTFQLPPGATLLASSDLTRHQLFEVDQIHYGLQFHLEITAPMLRLMIDLDRDILRAAGFDPEHFAAGADTALPRAEEIGRAVFGRWADRLLAK